MRKLYLIAALVVALFVAGPLAASPININQATAQQLAENLKGVGLKKAQAIVRYREKIGGFQTQDQLLDVKGIGTATLDKNQGIILLE
ncbi:MAG: helix-hairpin-helix domain-containing protein [Gammaproteobacteria bacterium]|nr:helix-hairpin-helix domain-containing protein [Gammaproteobacteria bacterium]